GVVLMFAYQAVRPAYFRGETLPKRDSGDLILVGDRLSDGLRLPDSVEGTVIAPDLSNLPPGATAIERATGREITLEPGQRYIDELPAEAEAREQTDELSEDQSDDPSGDGA